MKGEYIGKDGRTYRAYLCFHGTDEEGLYRTGGLGIHDPDWPAAKAALDELIVEEAEEWVELGYGIRGRGLRISRDGKRLQVEWDDGTWHDAMDYYAAADGYRKGREVAPKEKGPTSFDVDVLLAQHQTLREQVRELVEAVEDRHFLVTVYAEPEIFEWVKRVTEAAKAVKL